MSDEQVRAELEEILMGLDLNEMLHDYVRSKLQAERLPTLPFIPIAPPPAPPPPPPGPHFISENQYPVDRPTPPPPAPPPAPPGPEPLVMREASIPPAPPLGPSPFHPAPRTSDLERWETILRSKVEELILMPPSPSSALHAEAIMEQCKRVYLHGMEPEPGKPWAAYDRRRRPDLRHDDSQQESKQE